MTRRNSHPSRDGDSLDSDGSEVDLRRSRSSLKDERVNNENALRELIETLLKVQPANWTALGVPEEVQDALHDIGKIRDPGAQTRHKKFTRGLVRDLDWAALALRVEQFRSGQGVSDPNRELPRHVEIAHDLAVQGERGLARFLDEYPHANRTRLRQLIKNIENTAEAKRPRARAVLEQAVLAALEAQADGPDSSLP